MKPFKKILVPVDFSQSSLEAVSAAADVSSHYGAEVCLIHVYEPINYALPGNYPFYMPGQLESILAECEKRLAEAKNKRRPPALRECKPNNCRAFPRAKSSSSRKSTSSI